MASKNLTLAPEELEEVTNWLPSQEQADAVFNEGEPMKKVLVTGGSGLVGQHLEEIMPSAIYLSSGDYDLTDTQDTICMMYDHTDNVDKSKNIETVVHLAARVGGIQANIDNQVQFYEDNMRINTNVVEAARKCGVKNLIAMLSTCVYPDGLLDYPMEEDMLEDGPPAESNYGYGIAKRAMYSHIKLCREKLGLNYSCLIPCNLYGKHDNFNTDTCHYVPALIIKIIQAKQQGLKGISLWGNGEPLRQFMYAEDLAKFIKVCVSHDIYQDLNVATPEVKTIREIAEIALKACDAEHLALEFDSTKPNGQFRKDVSAKQVEMIYPAMMYRLLEYGIKEVYDHLMESGLWK